MDQNRSQNRVRREVLDLDLVVSHEHGHTQLGDRWSRRFWSSMKPIRPEVNLVYALTLTRLEMLFIDEGLL